MSTLTLGHLTLGRRNSPAPGMLFCVSGASLIQMTKAPSTMAVSPKRQTPTIEGAFSPEGVDLTAIRWMLAQTPAQRLQSAQDLIDAAWALKPGDEA